MGRTRHPKRRATAQVVNNVRNTVAAALEEARSKVRCTLSASEITNVLRLGNEYERSAMANFVGDLRLEEFEDELVEIVLRDTSPCVRHEAVYALGQIGSPRVLAMLTTLASSDMRIIVRHEATLALAGFRCAASKEHLAALKQDSSREIRDSATVALLQIENEAAESEPRDYSLGRYIETSHNETGFSRPIS